MFLQCRGFHPVAVTAYWAHSNTFFLGKKISFIYSSQLSSRQIPTTGAVNIMKVVKFSWFSRYFQICLFVVGQIFTHSQIKVHHSPLSSTYLPFTHVSRYMYHVLTKNTTVTDHNRNLLVETIRSITEILIWGDQNDSSVFE